MVEVEIEATVLFETGIGVLVGVAAATRPEADAVLGAFGILRPAAPCSVPSVWRKPSSAAPLDLNLPLAFKPKSQPAPLVARIIDPASKFSSP